MGKFKDVIKSNIIKTIYFNFKMLPLRQAIRLPVVFYGRVSFRSLKGKVSIKGGVSTGMIKVGIKDQYVDSSVPESIWAIHGLLTFTGALKMARGSYILVAKNAELTLGTNNSFYGSNLKILCFQKISIGDCARIAWDCQLYDSSFHYLELLNHNNEIKPLPKPVIIGDRVWIGNRSTVSKGSVIPNDTIVASSSLVNKDFSSLEPYSMIAGAPAVFKAAGLKRVWGGAEQTALDKKFGYSRHKL